MTSKLLAIRIRRRSIAAAVLSGRHLEYLDILHLCNKAEIATDAVARFLAKIIENFKPADGVLGTSRAAQGKRVEALTKLTENMLTVEGIPIWRVDDKTLLESYAVPRLRNKQQLLPIVESFWPHLGNRQRAAFEAAALGLYLQVERLLSHH
jgi:hypothetical protein